MSKAVDEIREPRSERFFQSRIELYTARLQPQLEMVKVVGVG